MLFGAFWCSDEQKKRLGGGALTGISVNPRIEKYENESMEKAKQKRVQYTLRKRTIFSGLCFCFPGG